MLKSGLWQKKSQFCKESIRQKVLRLQIYTFKSKHPKFSLRKYHPLRAVGTLSKTTGRSFWFIPTKGMHHSHGGNPMFPRWEWCVPIRSMSERLINENDITSQTSPQTSPVTCWHSVWVMFVMFFLIKNFFVVREL